jgi:hypothetical protein
MYDIELGQNDTDSRNAVLYQNSIKIDLTPYTISFHIENDSGTHYDITCVAQTGDAAIPLSLGGISIPFTPSETSVPGLYTGKFYLTDALGHTITVPTSSTYPTVMIWEAVP